MNKRRVTLNLDADVVEALKKFSEGSSMSAVANAALREAVERKAHHAALMEWMEELFDEFGRPSDEEFAEAEAFLDSVMYGEVKTDDNAA